MPSSGVNPFEFLDESCQAKLLLSGPSITEDFVNLACVVLIQ